MRSFDLTGKAAIVTGGSRGLGRAIALGLAGAGADVCVVSRTIDACEAVAREIEQTTGRSAMAHECHVGHWDQLDALVDAAWRRFGAVDVLVNNAGMSPLYDDVTSVSEELFDKVVGVNMKGPFRLTALAGARMAAGRGGSIVNVSSLGSLRPGPEIIPYAAAKAGLNAMTVGFAHAFGPTVRVNCVVPGAFATDATKDWDQQGFARAAASYPIPRMGLPEEIVGAVLYFAGDASSYTTGALLSVDGGAR